MLFVFAERPTRQRNDAPNSEYRGAIHDAKDCLQSDPRAQTSAKNRVKNQERIKQEEARGIRQEE